jgi:hypothetical protein
MLLPICCCSYCCCCCANLLLTILSFFLPLRRCVPQKPLEGWSVCRYPRIQVKNVTDPVPLSSLAGASAPLRVQDAFATSPRAFGIRDLIASSHWIKSSARSDGFVPFVSLAWPDLVVVTRGQSRQQHEHGSSPPFSGRMVRISLPTT